MPHNWTSFTLSIAVKNSLENIYHAWTQSAEIEKWFLQTCLYKNADGTAIDSHEAVNEGGSYEWTWFLYDVLEKGKITQANGKDFFQFSFAGECVVDIQLNEMGEHIMVTLTQHNIPTDENSKFNIRIGCLQGWTFFLTNLKSFYENNIDLRNKNPELKGANN